MAWPTSLDELSRSMPKAAACIETASVAGWIKIDLQNCPTSGDLDLT